MYIEFKLPRGAGGQAALHCKMQTWTKIQEWAHKRNIQIKYNRVVDYTLRVELARPIDYTVLALTWDPTSTYMHYTLVDSDINL